MEWSRLAGVAVVSSLLLALLAIDGAVSALQPRLFRIAAYDGQWTIAHVAADLPESRPDVAFMGASRVATLFDPGLVEREIEAADGVAIRAVNLAVTGANADTCRLVLENLIGDDRRPRVIVYGVYELEMLAGAKTLRQSLPYVSSVERLRDFADYADVSWRGRAWFLAEQLFAVERDRRLIRDALEIMFDPDRFEHSLYRSGAPPPGEKGFHRVPVSFRDPDPDRPRREYAGPLSRPRFTLATVASLERFLDLARRRGIDVILVDPPVTARHRAFWRRHEDMERYVALVGDVAERRGVPLLELYENPGDLVPDEGFVDTHHTNELGAAIVSRELVARVLGARFAVGRGRDGDRR